jgi:hypothetical protein
MDSVDVGDLHGDVAPAESLTRQVNGCGRIFLQKKQAVSQAKRNAFRPGPGAALLVTFQPAASLCRSSSSANINIASLDCPYAFQGEHIRASLQIVEIDERASVGQATDVDDARIACPPQQGYQPGRESKVV